MSKTLNKIKKISSETFQMKISSESLIIIKQERKSTKMKAWPKWIKTKGNFNQILQTNKEQILVYTQQFQMFSYMAVWLRSTWGLEMRCKRILCKTTTQR